MVHKKGSIHTLQNGTWEYAVPNGTLNEEIARVLGAKLGENDASGKPDCCFYLRGALVAVRTDTTIIAIFKRYSAVQAKMEKIYNVLVTVPTQD